MSPGLDGSGRNPSSGMESGRPRRAIPEPPDLEIDLNRDFGYGGFGNDIQGTFSIKVTGPDDLAEVQFYIDEILLGTDREAPFKTQFLTDDFDPGVHKIYAVGRLTDGAELRSRSITAEFLSSDSAMGKTLEILGRPRCLSRIDRALEQVVQS